MATRLDLESLGAYIREQRETAEVSLRELARSAGVSNPYLSQIERGLRRPSADILGQIAKGLRISAETLYVRAGLLDEHVGTLATTAAITADPRLTDRQRQSLLEVYTAFQSANIAMERAAAEQAAAEQHRSTPPDSDTPVTASTGTATHADTGATADAVPDSVVTTPHEPTAGTENGPDPEERNAS